MESLQQSPQQPILLVIDRTGRVRAKKETITIFQLVVLSHVIFQGRGILEGAQILWARAQIKESFQRPSVGVVFMLGLERGALALKGKSSKIDGKIPLLLWSKTRDMKDCPS